MNNAISGSDKCLSAGAREPEVFAELQSLRCAVNRIDGLAKNLSEKLFVVSRPPTPTCRETAKQQIDAPLAGEINTIKMSAIEVEEILEDIFKRLEI